jgi:hypothetical protein
MILLNLGVFRMKKMSSFIILLCLSLQAFAFDLPFEQMDKTHQEIIEAKKLVQQKASLEKQIEAYVETNKVLQDFTDYNKAYLQEISDSADGTHPIYGNELTYLSKSFMLYNLINKNFEAITKNLKKLPNRDAKNLLQTSIQVKQVEMFLENYLPFLENQTIRKGINEDDLTYGIKVNEFKKHIKKILGRKTHRRINKQSRKLPNLADIETENQNLKLIIDHLKTSPVYKQILSTKYKETDARKIKKEMKKLFVKDVIKKIQDFFVHHISGGIGNLLGSIRWRYGRVLHNEKINQQILLQLKPLDIITEKTWFAATDTFIPGHFGHNAIWLGTKEQLQEIGMWNHPSIVKIHKEIEAGKSIIESDRTGTHMKDLRTFMNVDEFAILRIKGIENRSKQYIETLYDVAVGQLGKTYDFNFDVETTDKLVCSELLYQTFGDIKWPTEVYLGRFTISPDNVTSLALFENSPIELVYYVAQVKKGIDDLRMKTISDLAKDMNFKEIDGKFYQPKKSCEKINKKKVCTTEYIPAVYN